MKRFTIFRIFVIFLLLSATKVFAGIPNYSNIIWHDDSCRSRYDFGRNILFSNTDCYLVWATESGAIFRDPATGDTLKIFMNKDSSFICPIFTADDSKFYAIGPTKHYVSLYDSKTLELLDTVACLPQHSLTQFFLSPDGNTLAAYFDKTVYSWDLTADRGSNFNPTDSVQQGQLNYGTSYGTAVPDIDGMDFMPDGNIIVKYKHTFTRNYHASGYVDISYLTIFQFFKVYNTKLDSIKLGSYSVPFAYSKTVNLAAAYYAHCFGEDLSMVFQDANGQSGQSEQIIPSYPDYKSEHLRIFNPETKEAFASIGNAGTMYSYTKPILTSDGHYLIIPAISDHFSNFYDISSPASPLLLFQINVGIYDILRRDIKAAVSHDGKYYAVSDGNGIKVHEIDWLNWQQHTASVNDVNIASCAVFPNPASDNSHLEINLNSPEFLAIDLFDASGKHIEAIASNFFPAGLISISLNPQNLPNGSYLIKITGKNTNTSQKLIIEK